MFSNKKGVSTLKYVYMITLSGLLFTICLILFYNLSFTILNDKQLEQELIIYNILYECSNENTFGFYSIENLNKDHFSQCLDEFEQPYPIRISFDIVDKNYNISQNKKITLLQEENDFLREKRFCSISSTKLCNTYKHSVLFVGENTINNGYITIEIIS